MFDHLTERLSKVIQKLSHGGFLTQAQVEEALKEIRKSLLEADVHFRVAKEICEKVQAQAVGEKILEKLSPGQQVIQIFHEKLIELLGGVGPENLRDANPTRYPENLRDANSTRYNENDSEQVPQFSGLPPVVVLVVGLQGSGKTTFCAKLASFLVRKQKKTVGLLPLDCARPAAKEQLEILAQKSQVPCFDSPLEKGSRKIAQLGLDWAGKMFFDVLIVDTAGRQQVDDELMDELSQISKILNPQQKFLVLDAMLGTQGLDVAKIFHEKIQLTGLSLSKLDSDARGGVALSARKITGVPIVFVGTGEKIEDLESFYPSRMANRILGMGDVLTLIEKTKESISEEDAVQASKKMFSGDFTLEDFREHLRRLKNMGPLEGFLKLIPGMGSALKQLENVQPEKELKRIEAMVNSMTNQERKNPSILNGGRKVRISRGSGIGVPEINRFLKQFSQMQEMMNKFKKMGMGSLLKQIKGAGNKNSPFFR